MTIRLATACRRGAFVLLVAGVPGWSACSGGGAGEGASPDEDPATEAPEVSTGPRYADAPPLAQSGVAAEVAQARTLARSGGMAEAEAVLRRAVERAPDQPEPALLLGQILLERAAVEWAYVTVDRAVAAEGLALVRGVAEARPDHVPTQLILGRGYCMAKDPGNARPVLEHVLRLAPGQPTAARLLAGILFDDGDAAAAAELLAPLVTGDAGSAADGELLLLWGMVLEDQERLDEALGAFERAVALAPYDDNARFKLASVLGALDRAEEADEALAAYADLLAAKNQARRLERAAEASDAPAALWIQAGDARAEMGDLESALADYARAGRADPTNPDALLGIARVHARRGATEPARAAFQAALAALEAAGAETATLAAVRAESDAVGAAGAEERE